MDAIGKERLGQLSCVWCLLRNVQLRRNRGFKTATGRFGPRHANGKPRKHDGDTTKFAAMTGLCYTDVNRPDCILISSGNRNGGEAGCFGTNLAPTAGLP